MSCTYTVASVKTTAAAAVANTNTNSSEFYDNLLSGLTNNSGTGGTGTGNVSNIYPLNEISTDRLTQFERGWPRHT